MNELLIPHGTHFCRDLMVIRVVTSQIISCNHPRCRQVEAVRESTQRDANIHHKRYIMGKGGKSIAKSA